MGYNYICKLSEETKLGYKYNLHECRIAAMAYEAGWKACNMKRNFKK